MGKMPEHGLQLHQWAWEFLRRNEAYLSLMSHYARPQPGGAGFALADAPEDPKLLHDVWRFGLARPVHPSIPGAGFARAWWSAEAAPAAAALPPGAIVFRGQTQLFLVPYDADYFRVRLSFTPGQLQARLNDLVVSNARPRRYRTESFARYLRAYDLKKTGLSEKSIGRDLEQGEDIDGAASRARDYVRNAYRLINGDYLKLLRLDPAHQTAHAAPSTPGYLASF